MDPRQAIALQQALRGFLKLGGSPRHVRLVAGADVAYEAGSDRLIAAVIVFRLPALEIVEQRTVVRPIRFPYVPGLLSFREAPAVIDAWDSLERRPDLLLCDGQGIAHPRGFGLASHLGLVLGVPAIGCAKSRLVGAHGQVGPLPGDRTPLVHDGRVVGTVLRTRAHVRPLYVSPGHGIGLAASVGFVLRLCRGRRLPEPTRQADLLVARLRRDLAGRNAR